MKAITVYTTTPCQGCKITKRKLDEAGITYQAIAANENPELAKMIVARAAEIKQPNQMPYVTIYDEHNTLVDEWFGLRPDKIEEHILEAN